MVVSSRYAKKVANVGRKMKLKWWNEPYSKKLFNYVRMNVITDNSDRPNWSLTMSEFKRLYDNYNRGSSDNSAKFIRGVTALQRLARKRSERDSFDKGYRDVKLLSAKMDRQIIKKLKVGYGSRAERSAKSIQRKYRSYRSSKNCT